MKNLVICVVFCLLVAYTSGSPFTDCGSKKGKVSSVAVKDCSDDVDECQLKRGTQADITINFSSEEDSKSLKAAVHGVIEGIPMPFPLPQPDACQSGVSCPVKNAQSYTYRNALNVRESYPPLSVTVRWELKDDNGNDMVCVEIPCKLV